MILSEDTYRKYFGSSPLDRRAEVDGNGNTIYEGAAAAGTADATPGWIICKHVYDANNFFQATYFYANAAGYTSLSLVPWTDRHTLLP